MADLDDVRRIALEAAELEELLLAAWRCTAPRRLVKTYDAGEG